MSDFQNTKRSAFFGQQPNPTLAKPPKAPTYLFGYMFIVKGVPKCVSEAVKNVKFTKSTLAIEALLTKENIGYFTKCKLPKSLTVTWCDANLNPVSKISFRGIKNTKVCVLASYENNGVQTATLKATFGKMVKL